MELDIWERIDVSTWKIADVEPSGSSRAEWLLDPTTGERWLHKSTIIPSNGIEQGEDWAEIVSTQVANLLGVPCAPTRLCCRDGRRGSISRFIGSSMHSLWEGAVVMADVPGFVAQVEGGPRAVDVERPGVQRPGHTLENIDWVLDGVGPPPGFEVPDGVTAFDVFAGYMILDALVANPDRHEQNWAKLTPQLMSLPDTLAPSYDHASSLGHNLQDSKREAILGEPGRLEEWAQNGRAGRFEHVGTPPTLVAHAAKAVEMCSDVGADWVKRQLRMVDLSPVTDALDGGRVPGMSEAAARFASELLDLNLRRLRDAIRHRS